MRLFEATTQDGGTVRFDAPSRRVAETATDAHGDRLLAVREVERRLPGVIAVGEWAHMRYSTRQHLVVEAITDSAYAARFTDSVHAARSACGQEFERFRVWHDAPKPHLPRCKRCAAADQRLG